MPGENCGEDGEIKEDRNQGLNLEKLQYHFQIKEMVYRYKLVGLTLNTLILIRVQYQREIVCSAVTNSSRMVEMENGESIL